MDEKLKSLLEAATVNIPVLDDAAPGIFPCVTFDFYTETGALFGEGTAQEEIAECQVDVWYKKKDDNAKSTIKAIKAALVSEKTYMYPVQDHVFDQTRKMHHTYFTFEVIKESEE